MSRPTGSGVFAHAQRNGAHMPIPRANLFGTSALALAVVALGTSPVVAQGEPQEVGSPEDGKEAGRAQAKAEKQYCTLRAMASSHC